MPPPEEQLPSETPQVQPSTGISPDVPYDNPIYGAVSHEAMLALREQRYADQAAGIEAHNQFTGLDQAKLYDPKTGILNQNLGKDAPQAVEKTLTDYQAQADKIRAGLGNDRQRFLFDRMSGEHLRTVQRQLYGYEHQQGKQWAGEQFEGAISNAQRQAVNTWNLPADPGQGDPVEHQVGVQAAAITDYGHGEGWPQELIDSRIADAKSKTYASVASDMLAKDNTQSAQALMEAHGADISGPERDTITRALRHTDLGNQAQQVANGFLGNDADGKPATRAQFLDKITNDPALQKNADLYDRVAERGERFFAMQDQARKAEQFTIGDQVMKAMNASPTTDPRQAAGPVAWEKLDGDTQDALLRRQQQALKREQPPEFTAAYYDLRKQVGTPAFQQTNLLNYVDKIAPGELKELAGFQAEQISGKFSPKFAATEKTTAILSDAFKQLNINDANDPAQSSARLALSSGFDRSVKLWMANNPGKVPDEDEQQAISDRLRGSYVTNVARSAFAQHFGLSPTTTQDQGALYKQQPGVQLQEMASQFGKEPYPGTKTRSGTILSKDAASEWVRTLSDPKSPGYAGALKHLLLWKRGMGDDGVPDPAYVERYNIIRQQLGR